MSWKLRFDNLPYFEFLSKFILFFKYEIVEKDKFYPWLLYICLEGISVIQFIHEPLNCFTLQMKKLILSLTHSVASWGNYFQIQECFNYFSKFNKGQRQEEIIKRLSFEIKYGFQHHFGWFSIYQESLFLYSIYMYIINNELWLFYTLNKTFECAV